MIEFTAIVGVAVLAVYAIRVDMQYYTIRSVGVYRRLKRYDVQTDHDCTDCNSTINDGEKRTATKEIVIFGCPILRTDTVTNYYCNEHSSFEYRQGEAVTPTREKISDVFFSIAEAILAIEANSDDINTKTQPVNSVSHSLSLLPVVFLVLLAGIIIQTIELILNP